MSKFKRELYDLMEKAYLEENDPIKLSFSNRVYKKYGNEFNKKYDYISGKNTEYITEQLRAANLSELDKIKNSVAASEMGNFNILEQQQGSETSVPMMYVPEEVRKEWTFSNTQKFFLDSEKKRELIEEYLSTLSEDNRKKAIAVMCENTNSKNFYDFLDLSTTAYTPNQIILSNDLINYFEQKYLNEFIDQQKTMQRFNAHHFSQQQRMERVDAGDAIYRETISNKYYYNPYDEKDMPRPKVHDINNEFLKNKSAQEELFEIIDKNSAMYLKQKTQFNNDHLNKELIKKAYIPQPGRTIDNHVLMQKIAFHQTNSDMQMLAKQQSQNAYHRVDVNLHNPSLIIEIPKTDNIADFIEQRSLLNYQNSMRKKDNIANTIGYNNQLVGANVQYNDVYSSKTDNATLNSYLKKFSGQSNINEPSVVYNNLPTTNENTPISSVMKIASENLAQQHLSPNQFNASANHQNVDYSTARRSLPQTEINNFSIDQLDPNVSNNRINMIRESAAQTPIQDPSSAYLNQREKETNNLTPSQFMQSNYGMVANTIGYTMQSKLKDFNDIQSFFTKQKDKDAWKPKVTKKIEEEIIPNKKRKAQGRVKTTTPAKPKKDSSALVVKQIKINRGIKDKSSEVKQEQVKKRVYAY